ncbi:transglycosylase SLT domain-containing protein [Limosilactobacillus reuteri]|uniref:lytic transglycosylase domain-containing protein n=1 Tax=Limosilactobacillus reuteri TaxID=1598 RepID=UPI001E4C35A8|nr:transglycosylase SLT domain-containing protein [Limosilactobacillus reuteri]MCC4327638.1 transglycosylase SLT domain-containing protein [Limosilactobacillus reuteri]MCC4335527.1 transglycosylase SLT domain-containing protein [Limosilactobacillus reuteri]MCC4337672.1 transglycosylase SLT domain-containing protein [Limosilactobacillus reuteri]
MLHSAIAGPLNTISSIWHSVWNSISSFFRGIWNGIKQAAQDGMNGVINVINAGIGGINKVWSFFTGHGTGVKELGHVHFAQGGTVHRHLSVINDGDGPDWKELVQTPDGNLFMSQERNWTGFLPEGTRVYSGAETRQIMNAVGVSHYATGGIVGAQHFADGGIIGKSIDWAKGSLENIGSWLGDKFSALEDFLADPLKATKGLLEKATSGMYKGLGNFADVAHGAMDKLTQPIADWFKKGLEKLEAQFESGGASPDLIRAAATKMHVAISGGDISHIMNVIKHESGGNARAINNWDINAKHGDPSKGILQFISSTFRKYAVAGHTNIYSPFDQLLAMFNDTTWRSDLTLGGWGPTGGRRFATGGEVFGLTNAIIGDNPEHHEFVLNPYAVSAESLLDRAFEATAQAQPASSSTGNGNSKLDQMIDLLGKVLAAVENQDTDVYLDGEKITDNTNKRNAKKWSLLNT